MDIGSIHLLRQLAVLVLNESREGGSSEVGLHHGIRDPHVSVLMARDRAFHINDVVFVVHSANLEVKSVHSSGSKCSAQDRGYSKSTLEIRKQKRGKGERERVLKGPQVSPDVVRPSIVWE